MPAGRDGSTVLTENQEQYGKFAAKRYRYRKAIRKKQKEVLTTKPDEDHQDYVIAHRDVEPDLREATSIFNGFIAQAQVLRYR